MPSKFLYHVTTVDALASIYENGLEPRAGKWHGPRRIQKTGDDKSYRKKLELALNLLREIIPRFIPWRKGDSGIPIRASVEDIQRVVRRMNITIPHLETWEAEADELGIISLRVSVENKIVRDNMLKLARLGHSIFEPRPIVDEWPSLVFLTTSENAAYEIQRQFYLDYHHGRKLLTVLTIKRDRIGGALLRDTHLHITDLDKRLARSQQRLRTSFMTVEPISPDAIYDYRRHSRDEIKNYAKAHKAHRNLAIMRERMDEREAKAKNRLAD